ncbi:Acetyltransferase (GNAT) family protein [Xaviernesmea oryzae]|uniref:Acetyltransferase (GNAT) family protein n=1 Tax=Xaviernesmea oryzae TaxID=464029 RepID=A0A1X7FV52_9HYPH|nr:GNAT family N-acetyltransferase [Xaviernesmea oryzae]SMF59306.1 Acetyltransferase (GNAT) family protein [Xaviernesmea oryzae]
MATRGLERGDLAGVLALMRQHAEFEGYAATFFLDENALGRLGFDRPTPAYHMLVSEDAERKIQGVALFFLQEFTFRNRPMLYLNDLVIDAACRRQGVASELIAALREKARELGCFRIKWSVSAANAAAIAFYDSIGAAREKNRFYYILDEVALPAASS